VFIFGYLNSGRTQDFWGVYELCHVMLASFDEIDLSFVYAEVRGTLFVGTLPFIVLLNASYFPDNRKEPVDFCCYFNSYSLKLRPLLFIPANWREKTRVLSVERGHFARLDRHHDRILCLRPGSSRAVTHFLGNRIPTDLL
jgi:hypothetical protein